MSGIRQDETALDSLLSVLEGKRTPQRRPGSELHLNVYDMVCMARGGGEHILRGLIYINTIQIWVNDYTSRFGIGAFHSGVQVYGRGTFPHSTHTHTHTHTVCIWEPPPHSTHTHTHTEYAYGGHPYSFTGVYDVEPQRAVEVAPGLKFRESIHLGHTHLTDREVEELVLSVGKEFNGNDYHIFNK